MTSKGEAYAQKRARLKKLAEQTLQALEDGSYTLPTSAVPRNLAVKIQLTEAGTRHYAPDDAALSAWSTSTNTLGPPSTPDVVTELSFLEISTIDGVRLLASTLPPPPSTSPNLAAEKIGVLNFASATKPGGGFLTGAQAQEESLARSSTLYRSLMTAPGQAFYAAHKRNSKGGYYTHAMVFSPGVVFFRDDDGGWTEPVEADVLTSAAVNAGAARNTLHGRVAGRGEEVKIAAAMRERMARVLFVLQEAGCGHLVLGSFGTGVFQNNVDTVARLWADLLAVDGAPFKRSFKRVVFAILGTGTFETFRDAFEAQIQPSTDT
ncbi:hypothetical protein FIBSPDRAFT_908646 [Athelia psychrophila]|uniref:Microbial-type PARG catalytic domain-containing protein n=1 Tax=Athelia psychrophila TaxID=1759441 RepID=A0A166RP10_9AGAM|nr:hypothetical protein FIBSPDRAFT_908646 [Fibularhizoctonia sp. CBS 109695]